MQSSDLALLVRLCAGLWLSTDLSVHCEWNAIPPYSTVCFAHACRYVCSLSIHNARSDSQCPHYLKHATNLQKFFLQVWTNEHVSSKRMPSMNNQRLLKLCLGCCSGRKLSCHNLDKSFLQNRILSQTTRTLKWGWKAISTLAVSHLKWQSSFHECSELAFGLVNPPSYSRLIWSQFSWLEPESNLLLSWIYAIYKASKHSWDTFY